MKKHISLILVLFFTAMVLAQPGTIKMTPVYKTNLKELPVQVDSFFKPFIADTFKLFVDREISAVNVYWAGGLTKPRFLHFNNKHVLHVIDFVPNGKLYALPHNAKADRADSLQTVVDGIYAHDFAFYKNAIYIPEQTRLLKCTDLDNDGYFETKEVITDSIGFGSTPPSGGHITRSIAIDEQNEKIYISVGSLCNVCREENRAVIEQYNLDGSGRKIFATGVRNAVGLTLHPASNKLWANNNGSDNQGNDIPPEWVDIIRENGFYGYPFAHSNQVYFNFEANAQYRALKPITAIDSAKVSKMVEPAALIQAHSAPMQMEFDDWYGSNLFMALRGSWNRTPATGYKIVKLDMLQSETAYGVQDYITGFLHDSLSNPAKAWGRPVGLAFAHANPQIIFVSLDNINPCILKFSYDMVGSTKNLAELTNVSIYPNPFTNQLNIKTQEKISSIKITSITGQVLFEHKGDITQINTENWLPGVYNLHIEINTLKTTKKIIKL